MTLTKMKAGTFHDYAGPIYDNKGKLRVPAGKFLTQAQDADQNWYVQGVSA
jgi:hypothetical protein